MICDTSPLSTSAPCTADRGRAREILSRLACDGLRRYGFGMKTGAPLQGATELLASAESLAWSLRARFGPPLPSCTHQRCSSCPGFALRWLQNIEPEVHRSATKAGVRRAYRLGLDLGRPRELPPPSRVRKLLKRGASIAEMPTALSCSACAVRYAIAHARTGQQGKGRIGGCGGGVARNTTRRSRTLPHAAQREE